MVGFRVFDVGLLVVWLIWFFRLRDDGDDSPGEDGGGGEGPVPALGATVPAATASGFRSVAGPSGRGATATTPVREHRAAVGAASPGAESASLAGRRPEPPVPAHHRG